ncbi:LamG domain-containing protein [Candidatus Poribacteria bacterium]|nr:LamG domain-containing protein [Candidatus Poribacteria bacterium]
MLKIIRSIIVVLVFTLLFLSPYANAQFSTDGVISYWSFDAGTINGKTVKDVLGENDGELDGNPKIVNGKVGKALEFDSTNFVHIPGTKTLDFNGAEAMSVSVWVYGAKDSPVDGAVAGVCCGTIVAQRDTNGWALRYDGRNGGAEYEFITQPGWQGDGGFGVAAFGTKEWHHLVAVVDGKKKYLYADGKLAKDGDYNGPMVGGTETEIGSAGDGGYIGIIDEVVIYDRAVTENEVKELFTAEGLPVIPQGKAAVRWGHIKSKF